MKGQTKSQGWEVGVSRTLPISLEKAWGLMLDIIGIIPPQKGDQLLTDDETSIEIRSYEPYSLIRMKWQPKDWTINSTLQIRVRSAKTGTTISVHHEWLQDAEQREQMRLYWTDILKNLAD